MEKSLFFYEKLKKNKFFFIKKGKFTQSAFNNVLLLLSLIAGPLNIPKNFNSLCNQFILKEDAIEFEKILFCFECKVCSTQELKKFGRTCNFLFFI